jgi:hypothetical protein
MKLSGRTVASMYKVLGLIHKTNQNGGKKKLGPHKNLTLMFTALLFTKYGCKQHVPKQMSGQIS